MTGMTSDYDVLVVGGGPAGLSSALNLCRTKRRTIVYDSGTYRNASAESFHTVLASDGGDPAKWRDSAREQILTQYADSSTFRRGTVSSIKVSTKGAKTTSFEVSDAEGKSFLVRKVILATGVEDQLTDVPGLVSLWGRRAIHCVYCHGTETQGQVIALLLTKSQFINGLILSSFHKKWRNLDHSHVYILGNGQPKPKNWIEKYSKDRPTTWVGDEIAQLTEDTGSDSSPITVHFKNGDTLGISYISTFAEKIRPPPEARRLLEPLRDSLGEAHSIFGVLPSETNAAAPGDLNMNPFGPKTRVEGIYWAGNVGNVIANVNIAVVNGQLAAVAVDDAIAEEDIDA